MFLVHVKKKTSNRHNRLTQERRSRDLKWVLNQNKRSSVRTRKFHPKKCRTFAALDNAKIALINVQIFLSTDFLSITRLY